MTALRDALESLAEGHQRIGSPLPGFLSAGLPAAAVTGSLAAVSLAAPEELVELYGWHDGTDLGAYRATAPPFGDLWIVPPFRFLPLAAAVEACRSARDTAAGLEASTGGAIRASEAWRPTWLPIMAAGPASIAVDCSDARVATPWIVRWDQTEWDPNRALAGSLRDLVDDLVRRFDAGAYSWDPAHGRLAEDPSRLAGFADLGA